jgi:hypothetical protein
MTCRHTAEMSDADIAAVLKGVIGGRPEGVTEDELERIVEWVHGVRMRSVMVDLLMSGELACRLGEGESEPKWWRPEMVAA